MVGSMPFMPLCGIAVGQGHSTPQKAPPRRTRSRRRIACFVLRGLRSFVVKLFHGSPMRAVIYEDAGGPEVISIGEVPKPEVRPDHVRVRVHAAGLNRADLIQRRGQYAA